MRILIINTQSINHNNATGITLRSIFGSFSADSLFEIYMQPCVKSPDSLPIRSERLSAFVCPVRYTANKLFKSNPSEHTNTVTSALHKISLRSRIKTRLSVILDYEPVFITPSLVKKIRGFNPDCIYTLGNSIDTMKLCVRLSQKFNIRIIPHFMDNWQASHRYGPDRFFLHIKQTQKWLGKMYKQSRCALVISEKMADIYRQKWGIPHFAIMNTVDVEMYHQTEPEIHGESIQLLYAGGLHLNRYKSLLDIVQAVEDYSTVWKQPIKLTVYTDTKSLTLYKDMFSRFDCVTMNQYIPHSHIMEIYNKSDVLIHTETFDREQYEFIQYSLSTKISEYLATGKPVFLYAPSDIFVSEYLNKYHAAITVSKQEDLKDALACLDNRVLMDTVSSNGYKLALKNHNIDLIQKVFQEACSLSVTKV